MNKEEVNAHRASGGSICYRPVKVTGPNGERGVRTKDGRTYALDGRTMKRVDPKVRMSKKARLRKRLLDSARVTEVV